MLECSEMLPAKRPAGRVMGIDSLRWLCALWVVLFHGNAPKLEWLIDRSQGWGRVEGAICDTLFCGPAAVIMFFCHFRLLYSLPIRRWPKDSC
jgi:peptidoglycan/LPS O-acetylase OafA/YrhL